jgi:rhomboid protease GluP
MFLTGIAVLCAVNLLAGFVIGFIDNAAHIGGLLSGLAVGLILLPSLKSRSPSN